MQRTKEEKNFFSKVISSMVGNRYKFYGDIGILVIGIIAQLFFSKEIVMFLGNEMCIILKTPMTGMASTIGLSTIVVFGFNLSKSVQQSVGNIIKEKGFNGLPGKYVPVLKVNYSQVFFLIILYICIMFDLCTLYYIVLAYDVFWYIIFVAKICVLENLSYNDIIEKYRKDTFKEKFLRIVLKNCMESNKEINIGAVKTFAEALHIFLEEYEVHDKDEEGMSYKLVLLHDKTTGILGKLMESIILNKENETYLLLAILREFCQSRKKSIGDINFQIELGGIITYVLDRKNNVNINIIYRELTNWVDDSLEIRSCISESRMEYLYAVRGYDEILLNDNIFYLYSQQKNKIENFDDLMQILWYIWCDQDKNNIILSILRMQKYIQLRKMELNIYNMIEAKDSLYMLIKGLKY